MKGWSLYKGSRPVEISLNRDHLLGAAWLAENNDMIRDMPIKFQQHHVEELEHLGYKLRPIQFARLAVDSAKKGRKK